MMNQVVLHGRLTADPELRTTQGGTAVCAFSLAVESGFGDKKRTDFLDCVAWKGTAEFLSRYFSKGQEALVSGKLQTRVWEDKEGRKRKSTEVVAWDVDFCGPRSDGAQRGGSGSWSQRDGAYFKEDKSPSPQAQDEDMLTLSEEDLPF